MCVTPQSNRITVNATTRRMYINFMHENWQSIDFSGRIEYPMLLTHSTAVNYIYKLCVFKCTYIHIAAAHIFTQIRLDTELCMTMSKAKTINRFAFGVVCVCMCMRACTHALLTMPIRRQHRKKAQAPPKTNVNHKRYKQSRNNT